MNNYEKLSSEEKLQKIQERMFPSCSIEELRKIQSIDWENEDLFREADLELLTCLKNLKSVTIHAHKDLSPKSLDCLKKLPCLESLSLYGTDVDDMALESLAEIESLDTLFLEHGTLTDGGLRNLLRFTNLKNISLSVFPNLTISGVQGVLQELPNLKGVDLPVHLTTDQMVDFLMTQTQLEMVELRRHVTDCGLRKITTLPNLKHLLCLNLKNVTEDGWKAVAECRGLELLMIHTAKTLTSFDFELPKLKVLGLKNTPNLKTCSFAGIPDIEELTIDGTSPELKGMEKLNQMKELKCFGPADHLEIYDAIAQMPQLENLTWTKCKNLNSSTIGSLSKLSKLKNLTLIELESPIEPEAAEQLADLSEMKRLCITLSARNSGTGLPFLKKMKNLESLSIDGVCLEETDLQSIVTLKKLSNLMVMFNCQVVATGLHCLTELPILESLKMAIDLPKNNEEEKRILNETTLPVVLKDLPVLHDFMCFYLGKIELTLENLPKLRFFSVRDVAKVEAITIKNLPFLIGMGHGDSYLKRLTLSNLPEMQILDCDSCTSLKDLRVQGLPALMSLRLSNTPVDIRGIGIFESVKNLSLELEQCRDDEVLLTLQCLPNLRSLNLVLPDWVSKFEEKERAKQNESFLPPQDWTPDPKEDDLETAMKAHIFSALERIQKALPNCSILPMMRVKR